MNVTVLMTPVILIVLSSNTNRFSYIHCIDYTIFYRSAGKIKNRLPPSEIDDYNWAYVQRLFWDGEQLQQSRTISCYVLCISCPRYASLVSAKPGGSPPERNARRTLAVYQLICPDEFGYAPGLSDTSSRFMRDIAIKYL